MRNNKSSLSGLIRDDIKTWTICTGVQQQVCVGASLLQSPTHCASTVIDQQQEKRRLDSSDE